MNRDFTLCNISSDINGYQQLINLQNTILPLSFKEVPIKICTWFDANLAAPLGGILDYAESKGNTVRIDSLDESVKAILQKNGFLAHFGYPQISDTHLTTIKYLKLKPTDTRYFHLYILNDLLQRPELPALGSTLKRKIAESIYEIFVNAQIHSKTSFIYTCGQFYPQKNELIFTICDTGIGFKETIQNRFNKKVSAKQAILWAITDGHTTKVDISGGIGLAILKDFIVQNKGTFQIISNDGFYELSNGNEKYTSFSGDIHGSIVTMKINTNDTTQYDIPAETDIFDIF
jgi:signal transduction histidine kinase